MSICTSFSASSARIVSPPLPITMPIFSGSIFTVEIRGAFSASSVRTSAIVPAIRSRMNSRACFAWDSAWRMISWVTPVILMSIWSAVTPSRVPATLKSMSPRWSSAPWMSVRIT
jgi:hypothetical protein